MKTETHLPRKEDKQIKSSETKLHIDMKPKSLHIRPSDISEKSDKALDAFVGFKTASGQKVETDASKLEKYKTWFDEKAEDANKDNALRRDPVGLLQGGRSPTEQAVGFTSASGKKIDVKSDAVDKFAKWFEEDMDQEISAQPKKTTLGKPQQLDGKDMSVENTHSPNGHQPHVTELMDKAGLKGFQTAGGKTIKVSADSAEKFASWFEEPVSGEKDPKPQDAQKGPSGVSGFQTAAGTSVSISSSAAAKFKRFFEEDVESQNMNFQGGSTTHEVIAGNQAKEKVSGSLDERSSDTYIEKATMPKLPIQMGFKTAKGQDLSVKKEVLAKYEKMFHEDTVRDDPMTSMASGVQKAMGKHSPDENVLKEKDTNSEKSYSSNATTEGEKDEFDNFLESLKRKSDKKEKEKDYSKLPKGFRPFKRPRMITQPKEEVPTKPKEEVPTNAKLLDVNGQNLPEVTLGNKTGDKEADKTERKPNRVLIHDEKKGEEDANDDAFNDSFENFTYTQITEATNCAEAFLASEGETSFTQVQPDTTNINEDRKTNVLEGSAKTISQQDHAVIKTIDHGHSNTENLVPSPKRKTTKVSAQSESKLTVDPHLNPQTGVPLDEPKPSVSVDVEMSTSKSHSSSASFLGFSTASGKSLRPSTEAMTKVKSIFEACDDNSAMSETAEESCDITGVMGVSEKSIKKTSTIQTTRSHSETPSGEDRLTNNPLPVTKKAERYSLGFETAAGRKITVSEESLLEVREQMQTNQPEERSIVGDHVNPQANTSANQNVADNIELARVPVIADVEPSPSTSLTAGPLNSSSVSPMEVSPGIHQNSSAVSHMPSLPFQESILKENTSISLYTSRTSQPKPSSQPEDAVVPQIQSNISPVTSGRFQGFQSAAGKSIGVSSAALHKVKGLFDDLPSDKLDSNEGASSPADKEKKNCHSPATKTRSGKSQIMKEGSSVIIPAGLTTASGKSVSISAESLNQAKQLLVDDESSFCSNERDGPALVPQADKSPGNSVIDQSRHQGHLSKNQGHSGKEQNKADSQQTEHFRGFATAGGKKVSISVKALNHVKQFFNDIENAQEETSTEGFATASGKQVNVSSAALEKARSTLKAAEYEVATTDDTQDSSVGGAEVKSVNITERGFGGFQTARGTSVPVSSEALKKARTLFDDSDETKGSVTHIPDNKSKSPSTGQDCPYKSNGETFKNGNSRTSLGFPSSDEAVTSSDTRQDKGDGQPKQFAGFATAGGKKVSISEKALNHVKQFFDDVEEENVAPIKEPFGFATASGKHVNVSSSALEKARNNQRVAEAETSNSKDIPGLLSATTTTLRSMDNQPGCGGFQTARGGSVSVSADALNRARTILNDCDEKDPEKDNSGPGILPSPGRTSRQLEKQVPKASFMGFQTAGGSEVKVSETALKQVKDIFTDDENNKTEDVEGKTGKPVPKASFMGFQTAGGAKVKVSETALKQVKDIFTDDENNKTEDVEGKTGKPVPKASFMGFQTAGGAKVKVSEAALKQVKDMFTDDESNTTEDLEKLVPKPSFMGFQTAGGSKVKVSESALNQVKDLFREDEDGNAKDECNRQPETPVSRESFMGFKTAGGSKVKISEDALKQVKEQFNDEKTDEKTDSDTTSLKSMSKSLPFTGFETAKGSKVNVSGEALRQVRTLTDENETSDQTKKGQFVQKEHKTGITEKQSSSLIRTPREKRSYRDEEIMYELSESSKAFLADGADETLDEEAFFPVSKAQLKFSTSTPDGAHHKAQSRVVPPHGGKSLVSSDCYLEGKGHKAVKISAQVPVTKIKFYVELIEAYFC